MQIDFLSKIGMRGGKTYYSTRFEFVEIKIGIIGDIIIAHPVSRYWDTGCAEQSVFFVYCDANIYARNGVTPTFTSATKQMPPKQQSLQNLEGVLTTYSDHRHTRSIWRQLHTSASKIQFGVAESVKSTVIKQKNVPRLVGVVEAAGSSPVTQTKKTLKTLSFQGLFSVLLRKFLRGVTQFATQSCVTPLLFVASLGCILITFRKPVLHLLNNWLIICAILARNMQFNTPILYILLRRIREQIRSYKVERQVLLS